MDGWLLLTWIALLIIGLAFIAEQTRRWMRERRGRDDDN